MPCRLSSIARSSSSKSWAEVAEELKGTVALSMCEHNNTVPGTDVHSWFERWILEKYGKEAGMGQGA